MRMRQSERGNPVFQRNKTEEPATPNEDIKLNVPDIDAEIQPEEIEVCEGCEDIGRDGGAAGGTELAQSGQSGDESTLTIDTTVVEKIVAITCRSVDGILQMKGNFISSLQEGFGGTDVTKGVTVEMVGEDACNVNVSIIMEYGKSAPKIFRELRDKISEKITDMTGLRVNSVNVRITNVMTREEVEGGRRREKEKGEGDQKGSVA